MRIVCALTAGFVVLALAGCGGESEDATNGAAPTGTSAATTEQAQSGEHFTLENWDLLAGEPDGHKGASVDIVGKIFLQPERDSDGVYFQMYADPTASEFNTIVGSKDTRLRVKDGDYVHVLGEVGDAYEGENAFGAELTVPVVIASEVEVVDATAAAPPALETYGPDVEETSGITFTASKVEFAESETRLFLTVANHSGADFSVHSFNTKALQGTKQFEAEFSSDYPEVPSEVLDGAEVSGVIVFPAMDPALGLRVPMEGYSDSSDIGEYGSLKWEFQWTG
jgi:hypothetical protein